MNFEATVKKHFHLLCMSLILYFFVLVLIPALNKWIPHVAEHPKRKQFIELSLFSLFLIVCLVIHFQYPRFSMNFFSTSLLDAGLYGVFAAFMGWVTYKFFIYPMCSDIDPFGVGRTHAAHIKHVLVNNCDISNSKA